MRFVLKLVIPILFLLLITALPLGHALYTVNLPSNTIYADDFENYAQAQKVGCSATSFNGQPGTGYVDGWGFKDCSTGGFSDINNTAYLSCCKSLWLRTLTSNTGAFDIDKRFFRPLNTTRIIQFSFWFALSANFVNETGNGIHFAMETYTNYGPTGGNHLEIILRVVSHLPGPNAPACAHPSTDPALKGWVKFAHQDSANLANIANTETATDIPGLCMPTYEQTAFGDNVGDRRDVWSHVVMSADMLNYRWNSLQINGFDYTSSVCPSTCYYAQIHAANNTWGGFAPQPIRFEIGLENAATHIPASDTWYLWIDDLQISDITGGPSPVIQFGVSLFSGWFPVLMAAVGVLYGTSGIGLARRVILGKTEGLLSNYRMIFITGIIATVGFIVILAVGALLTQQVCQNTHGATCSY